MQLLRDLGSVNLSVEEFIYRKGLTKSLSKSETWTQYDISITSHGRVCQHTVGPKAS